MFQQWPDFPIELKLEVLQHALHEESPIAHSRHVENLHTGQLSSLIGTRNKELTQLAIDTYYKSNTFTITPNILSTGIRTGGRVSEARVSMFRPRVQQARLIQRLVVELTTCLKQQLTHRWFNYRELEPGRMFLHQSSLWNFMFRLDERRRGERYFQYMREDGGVKKRTEWQRTFTSLKSLVLHVRLGQRYTSWDFLKDICQCHMLNDTIQILAYGTADIKAKDVAVVVDIEGCQSGICQVEIAEVLQGILTGNETELGA
ncbi:hypothetical protein C7974DRAFT_412528 [Boeremia exigua]|uniref:uncharacterized protein n=1 Tax=Boeremia exigua TaxID=749465 RepID=UPI001E8CED5F|nr:uncharacterized protein C7974DRAFT_412528 [Boeremia exigua]KAH6633543.1 hypothetical protein C7974DRAFT_412528 [Boeremia exigua]